MDVCKKEIELHSKIEQHSYTKSVRLVCRRTKDLPSLSSDERVFRRTKDTKYYVFRRTKDAITDLFKCIFKMHLKVAPYFHWFSIYIISWKKLQEWLKSHLTDGANKICNHVSFVEKSFVRRKTWSSSISTYHSEVMHHIYWLLDENEINKYN